MPVLLQEAEVQLDWNDIHTRVQHNRHSDHTKRSSGIHLSGVLKPVLIGSGKLKPIEEEYIEESLVESTSDQVVERVRKMPLRVAIGMAWEEWAVGLWPNLVWQPGECRQDGVIGSPDGFTLGKYVQFPPACLLRFSTPYMILEEFKATWYSRRTYGEDVTDMKIWMWQLAGYCQMMGIRIARLHVLWVNNEYKWGPPCPAYYTYLLEFTERELDQFWDNVILNNLDLAVPEVHAA